MGRLRRLIQLRQERKEQVRQIGSVNMDIENTPWRSKLVIEAKHLCKSFGDRTIVNDFSTKIIRGNRIGIVGPNGAGKTTLIKLLTKKLAPDSGFVRIGKTWKKPILIRTVLSLTRANLMADALRPGRPHLGARQLATRGGLSERLSVYAGAGQIAGSRPVRR